MVKVPVTFFLEQNKHIFYFISKIRQNQGFYSITA